MSETPTKLDKLVACKVAEQESNSLIAIGKELGLSRSQVLRTAIARYIGYWEEEKRRQNAA
jgi:hypothetical protein